MAFVIEKNIPMPAKRNGVGSTEILRSMKVGDSFLLGSDVKKVGQQTSIRHAAKRAGIVITVRATDKGFRVWRTA